MDLPKGKVACMTPDGTFTVNKNLDLDKDKLLNVVFHEFRHAKQNELMCSKDPERFAVGIYNRSKEFVKKKDAAWCENLRNIIRNNPEGKNLSEKEVEELIDTNLQKRWIKAIRKNTIEKLGLGKSEVPESLNEYIEKCFKAHSNYNDANVFAYYNNFLEKDARKSGKGMQRIIMSIPDKLG